MSGHLDRVASLRAEACMPSKIEALARKRFERACRNDTFDDIKRRAAFNRQDAGHLRHWIRGTQVIATDGFPTGRNDRA